MIEYTSSSMILFYFFGIITQYFKREVLFFANITIMVRFISLILPYNLLLYFCALFLQHKITKQHSTVIILHTEFKRWPQDQFESKSDCWDQDWFTIGIWPLIKWPSFLWYGTHSLLERELVLDPSAFIDSRPKTSHENRLCFVLPIMLFASSKKRSLGIGIYDKT